MIPHAKDLFKHQCRVNGDYYFDSCCVTTCKNFSPILDSKCLLIERKECLNSDKGMSDHEIKFFKGYEDVRQVAKKKKKAFDSVYSILILEKYIEYCKMLPRLPIPETVLQEKVVRKALKNYPLNLEEFHLPAWVLVRLTDDSVYQSFSVKDCKMCNEYSLTDILQLDAPVLLRVSATLKSSIGA